MYLSSSSEVLQRAACHILQISGFNVKTISMHTYNNIASIIPLLKKHLLTNNFITSTCIMPNSVKSLS